ncbi:hypothetical protein J5N97_010115 [Dioscorea zingiberensis]|uniref:Uncharacterized protein n=1 Tax=Dioscorea zingiberensis TaxID=325984 RepID=A0A9D5CXT5_9LILI|nr:hypothetical protein J5N97_010115 [Dioscorea zingiberensis]
MQKHPKVGNHANKELKEFERLQGIFGKDRANGKGAETATNVVESLNADKSNFFDANLELNEEHTSAIPTENHVSNGPNVSTPPLKRQKMLDVANKFIESMESYMSAAKSDMSLILTKMPGPPVLRNLGEEVKKLGLSDDEEVDLMIKFSHKPNCPFSLFFAIACRSGRSSALLGGHRRAPVSWVVPAWCSSLPRQSAVAFILAGSSCRGCGRAHCLLPSSVRVSSPDLHPIAVQHHDRV